MTPELANLIEYVERRLPEWQASLPTEYGSRNAACTAYLSMALPSTVHRPDRVPGVYAFWIGELCLYVGESTNLKQRLAGHPKKRQLPGSEIRWLACTNHKQVEKWLIETLRPVHNGSDPDTQAMREMKRAAWELIPIEERWMEMWSMLSLVRRNR